MESKAIKTELHDLALRRLRRARETSTERVIDLLKFWMKGKGKQASRLQPSVLGALTNSCCSHLLNTQRKKVLASLSSTLLAMSWRT